MLSWDEMLALGRGALAGAIPPKPEDLCTIMYTSGTTGNPKACLAQPNNPLPVLSLCAVYRSRKPLVLRTGNRLHWCHR